MSWMILQHFLVFSYVVTFVLAVYRGDGMELSQQTQVTLESLNSPHITNDSNQKFLRVLLGNLPPYINVTRNSTGHLVDVRGVAVPVLEWLSLALNFQYILVSDNIPSVEDYVGGKGSMTYVVEGRADMILAPIVMTPSRYKNLNFPHPFVMGQFGLIIPTPSVQVNVAAVSKPFQREIWIFFFAAFLATIMFLFGINFGISVMDDKAVANESGIIHGDFFEDMILTWQYVMGALLSQGMMANKKTNRNQKLTVRLLSGAWCLTCFVLVTAYSSVLISFVTSPNYKPLIKSIYDFPKDPQVKITVDKGLSADLIFTTSEGGIFKYLGDQLRREPDLRCSTTEKCLNKVRNGSYVYTQVDRTIENIIGIDLIRTGRCEFTIAKDRYLRFSAGLVVSKNANVNFYNIGIMKAHEGGFVELWADRNVVDASRCLNPPRNRSDDNIRLTLGGLSGAFLVLAFGYCLSVIVFITELVYKRCSN